MQLQLYWPKEKKHIFFYEWSQTLINSRKIIPKPKKISIDLWVERECRHTLTSSTSFIKIHYLKISLGIGYLLSIWQQCQQHNGWYLLLSVTQRILDINIIYVWAKIERIFPLNPVLTFRGQCWFIWGSILLLKVHMIKMFNWYVIKCQTKNRPSI